jgi:hypothetical protein
MRPTTTLVAATLGLAAHAAHAAEPPPLPLKRVRLYEAGVGYFERAGALRRDQPLALPVPAGHLDDALKTLVVLTTDAETRVSGIEFASSVSRPMARALAGLESENEQAIDYDALLTSLKGASVRLQAAGGAFSGRLVEVIVPPAPDPDTCVVADAEPRERGAAGNGHVRLLRCVHGERASTLVVVTDAGELRRFRSTEVQAVRPTDPAWSARLGSALDALALRGAQRSRALQLLANGGRDVALGYVAETPVWRPTYRLVLDDPTATRGALQGWALVHNDTDEDWRGVRVELVNGRPDSFLFPLAAPRYAHRELVTPEHDLSTVPQLLGKTVDNMWTGGLGLSGIGSGGGGRGMGIGLGHGRLGAPQVRMGSVSVMGAASSLLSVGNLAPTAPAAGVEAGALFRYALGEPVELRARGSALLPFVSSGVGVRRLTYFDAAGQPGRSAVEIANDTQQTLPEGTLAVFEDGGFAGEAALGRAKPGEKRIVRYGVDLDVELEELERESRDEPRILVFRAAGGESIEQHYLRHTRLRYALSNRSGAARTATLALEALANADVRGAEHVSFDQAERRVMAAFAAPPKERRERELVVVEGRMDAMPLASVGVDALRGWARSPSLAVRERGIARRALAAMEEAGRHAERGAKIQTARAVLDQDIGRLRAHLAALGGQDADGAEDIVRRLLEAEDRLLELRAALARSERAAASALEQGRAELRLLAKP